MMIDKLDMNDTFLVLPSTLRNNFKTHIGGYRHDLNPILAAALVSQRNVQILNVPDLEETKLMVKILRQIGIDIELFENSLQLKPSSITTFAIPESLSKHIHGVLYLIPAVLSLCKKVCLGKTGGCQIGNGKGERPIDHLSIIFERFGVNVDHVDGKLVAYIEKEWNSTYVNIQDFSNDPDILTGPRVSSATKLSILLALNVKQGKTIIDNPSLRVGTNALLAFCKTLGYKVEQTSSRVTIEYVENNSNIIFALQADPTEVITFLTLSVINKLKGTLVGVDLKKLAAEIPMECEYFKKNIRCNEVRNNELLVDPSPLIEANIFEASAVGIATDSQPFLALLLAYGNKDSLIREKIWKNRFDYAKYLNALGYCMIIKADDEICIKNSIQKPEKELLLLTPNDLRSVATTLLGVLSQKATCVMTGMNHIERGYDRLFDKLRNLGAKIIVGDEMKYLLQNRFFMKNYKVKEPYYP